MNILDYLFAIQRMKDQKPIEMDPLARERNPWAPDPAPPNLRYRDPEQAGPAPPTDGPLAQMFGDKRGQLRRPR